MFDVLHMFPDVSLPLVARLESQRLTAVSFMVALNIPERLLDLFHKDCGCGGDEFCKKQD